MAATTRDAFLRRAAEFAEVKKRGVRLRSGPMLLCCARGPRPRLGMVVTRRIGTAVKRNRLRRIIREFFRCNLSSFPRGDCVVIPQAGISTITNDQIRRHLRDGLARLGKRMERR